jgi:hypothetical protein
MPGPETAYEAVLTAARDVTKLTCAFDAELLGTALLGSVYAVAEEDREAAVRDFVGGFLVETADSGTPAAATIRRVFAALVPDAAGATGVGSGPGSAPAPWVEHLGRVRVTGSYAYGDVYGDQTSYVATFAYDDEEAGGPEHAVVALIDHNIGIAKDVFIGGPAESIVTQIRELCDGDELTWFEEVPPQRVRGEVARHLAFTDSMGSLPAEGSLATDRALAGARLAVLPPSPPVEPAPLDEDGRRALVAEFLASPQAARAGLTTLDEAEGLSFGFCLSLLLDHAETFPDADPLRWSPVMAELFLLHWVHRRAVLDDADAAMLPRTLRAWMAYAADRKGLPAAAAERALDAVDELAPEFARLHASGERRGAAAQAVADLMVDGVDPQDAEAVDAWLRDNDPGGDRDNGSHGDRDRGDNHRA